MKQRTRLGSRKRLSSNAAELSRLALGAASAGSRVEENFWEMQLGRLISRILEEEEEEDLNAALSHLIMGDEDIAHNILLEVMETCAECCVMTHQNQAFDVLLIGVPILAWSRFSVPSGKIPPVNLQALKVQLGAHVFARDAKILLMDQIFSLDQTPDTFVETANLTQALGKALFSGVKHLDFGKFPETTPFLSDVRYLVGVVAVPQASPIFRWNEADGATKESVLREWVKQGAPNLEPQFTGCSFELMLPEVWHAAGRISDVASRPYFLKASVAFLQAVFSKPADAFVASIGAFYDRGELLEYRIGLGPKDDETIFHGVTWHVISPEEENGDFPSDLEDLLKEAGIKEVVIHEERFPFEMCDDCGAPLFPNLEGELVHAEMPEEQEENVKHTLH